MGKIFILKNWLDRVISDDLIITIWNLSNKIWFGIIRIGMIAALIMNIKMLSDNNWNHMGFFPPVIAYLPIYFIFYLMYRFNNMKIQRFRMAKTVS